MPPQQSRPILDGTKTYKNEDSLWLIAETAKQEQKAWEEIYEQAKNLGPSHLGGPLDFNFSDDEQPTQTEDFSEVESCFSVCSDFEITNHLSNLCEDEETKRRLLGRELSIETPKIPELGPLEDLHLHLPTAIGFEEETQLNLLLSETPIEEPKVKEVRETRETREANEELALIASIPAAIGPEEARVEGGQVYQLMPAELTVVVQGIGQAYSLFDTGTILCLENGRVLGVVRDIFGSKKDPFYEVRVKDASVFEGLVQFTRVMALQSSITLAIQNLEVSSGESVPGTIPIMST